jgi:hypothetical protein
MRRRTFLSGLAAVVAAAAVAVGSQALAEEPAGGMPSPQKKLDHPFVKEMVGVFDFVSDMGKGTSTIRLGLGDTAVIEDLEASMGPMPYFGHGVRKVSDDGKTMTLWWFDSTSAEPDVYTGPLTAEGFDLKSPEHRITMTKTATGFEFKIYQGDQLGFTAQYTKKK